MRRVVFGAASFIFTLILGFSGPNNVEGSQLLQYKNLSAELTSTESILSKIVCKTGTKIGKTPVSLVKGAKVGCYNIKQASAGKKLLTSDYNKSCFACHSKTGVAPASLMNANLRTQGYSLKPVRILAAFNAHAGEMAGATLTASQAKLIGQYLQSIR